MKRIIRISVILAILVGACAAKLIYNKSRIDANARPDTTTIAIPVSIEIASMKPMDNAFSLTGIFNANKELTLLAEGQGRVLRVFIDAGDAVKEGQVIAELDDILIKSQLTLAEANLDKASKDLKKFESMAKSEAVTAQQLQEIRLVYLNAEANAAAARKQMENTRVTAPFSGTVTKRYIEKGSLIMPGTPVVDLVDISVLKFTAGLNEKEVVSVKKGDVIRIQSELYPGVEFSGKIKSIGVKSDEAKRYPVEIEIRNQQENPLRAGMFAVAIFSDGKGSYVLSLSRKCIVGSIKDPHVYVVENNTAVMRKLMTGKITDSQVEVISGLKPGERVVFSGQINLEDGRKVSIVNP
ncbi:MAG: efflux RND transporter periplasmic adaptor subunit [Bacteroidales bacterium]